MNLKKIIFKIIILISLFCSFFNMNLFFKNLLNSTSPKLKTSLNLSVSDINQNQKFSLISSKKPLSKSSEWYGRIVDDNVYFYASPNSGLITDAYFKLTQTYFVKLIEEANSLFYKAQYLDLVGYVKKSEVYVTSDIPKTPYLNNINFRIYSEISQTMRSVPSSSLGSQTQVCYLPYFSKDALYYGSIEGESAIIGRTNVWYFCRYFSDKAYYGYIYSDGCDQMTKIESNNEVVRYVSAPNFNEKSEETPLTVISSSNKSYVLIIILISIPVAIFLIMIVRSGVILKSNKKEKAKEIKLFFDS